MNYPTASKPAVLVYRGHVPTKKNQTVVRMQGNKVAGVTRPRKTRQFILESITRISDQWGRQGFDIIPSPELVGVASLLIRYVSPRSKIGLPRADDDGAYTTIQDTLENIALESDNQISFHMVLREQTERKDMEFCIVFLWHMKETAKTSNSYVLNELRKFMQYYESKSLTDLLTESGIYG